MNRREMDTLFSISIPLDKLYLIMRNADECWDEIFTEIKNKRKYKAFKKIIYKHLDQIQITMDTMLGSL